MVVLLCLNVASSSTAINGASLYLKDRRFQQYHRRRRRRRHRQHPRFGRPGMGNFRSSKNTDMYICRSL